MLIDCEYTLLGVDQGCRQGCGIGVAFGGCGSINVWIVCVHVPTDVCILAFFESLRPFISSSGLGLVWPWP